MIVLESIKAQDAGCFFFNHAAQGFAEPLLSQSPRRKGIEDLGRARRSRRRSPPASARQLASCFQLTKTKNTLCYFKAIDADLQGKRPRTYKLKYPVDVEGWPKDKH